MHSFFMCSKVTGLVNGLALPPLGCDSPMAYDISFPALSEHAWIAQHHIFYLSCAYLAWIAISSFVPSSGGPHAEYGIH